MALGNKTLDDLLAPISKQLDHERIADSIEMPAWEFVAERVTDGMTHEQLIEKFVEEAEKVRVQVTRCSSGELADVVAGIVAQGQPETGESCSVVCANEARFETLGVYNALRSRENIDEVSVWDPQLQDENVNAALKATYGITYATGGIAETATIVQPTSALCGRAISLLPLVHVAVVDASTIVPTMLEIMKSLKDHDASLPSQVCFISGPSATADIELVRVEGVHGPMYVYYVVVD